MLVDLTTARNSFEADVIVQALRAEGIPAESFTLAASMLQWDIAASQPFRVSVRRGDLDRAAQVLRAVRAESVDIDWEDLDPGPPEDAADVPEAHTTTRTLWRTLWLVLGALLIVGFLAARWSTRRSP